MSDEVLDTILRRVDGARSVLLFSHVSPDGDAAGSSLGLLWLLRGLNKHAQISFEDPLPPSFCFLPGAEEVADRPLKGHDLVIALDGSDADRYGANFTVILQSEERPFIIGIDHHKTNTRFADLNWVDSNYAATAQMVYHLARYAGWPIPVEAAICLATGCVTDTNAFSTDHTTPEVLEDVAGLMRKGAPLAQIIRTSMHSRTFAEAALWGRILSTARVGDGVAWAVNRVEDRADVGAGENDGGGIATFLRNIKGVHIGIHFVEVDERTVRVSMRSRPGYDVSGLALEIGGGGHAQAAGATLNMSLEEACALVVAGARVVSRAGTAPVAAGG
jgi:bifunctional oligoribonuclease and PAP phosphatase NrnA